MSVNRIIGSLAVATASIALALPSATSASTAIPPLATGDAQAFVVSSAGTHVGGVTTVSGSLTLRAVATISCTSTALGTTWTPAGTSQVTSLAVSGCTVAGFPSCQVATVATPGSLPWGARFYRDGSGSFRDYLNASIDFTFSGSCPFAGTFTYTPTGGANGLRPAVALGGATLKQTFDPGAGSLTSTSLGMMTFGGNIAGRVASGLGFAV